MHDIHRTVVNKNRLRVLHNIDATRMRSLSFEKFERRSNLKSIRGKVKQQGMLIRIFTHEVNPCYKHFIKIPINMAMNSPVISPSIIRTRKKIQ